MNKRPVLIGLVTCCLAAGAVNATAAPAKKKPEPVTKTYTATAFPPDPSYGLGLTSGTCNQMNTASQHNTSFKAPFAGTLAVDLKDFDGDWDLAVYDERGTRILGRSQQAVEDPLDRPERVVVKIEKAYTTVQIRACNFLGGQTATVTYVHAPA
jgi:hypothetical protein